MSEKIISVEEKQFSHFGTSGYPSKRLLYTNISLLSAKDRQRFLDGWQDVKETVPWSQYVETWNHYAKNINQHVFVQSEEINSCPKLE